MKQDILRFLKENKEKTFYADFLCEYFDIGAQKLRGIIHQLRVESNPIVSGKYGYKYTDNRIEIIDCYNSLKSRALKVYHGADGLMNYLKENDVLV